MMNDVFNLGRPIKEDSTFSYKHLAYKNNLSNYRLISSGEILIRGRQLGGVPEFVTNFIKNNNEVVMIANIIAGKVIGLTFRSIEVKDFLTWGNTKGLFYGIGDLDKDFKYGDPIILVEGILDRDTVKTLYPNVLAVLTSDLTINQVAVITRLTNNIILMLDNDEAGKAGTQNSLRKLKQKCKVKVFDHYPSLKDAGDLVKLEIKKDNDYNFILEYYKTYIKIMIGSD